MSEDVETPSPDNLFTLVPKRKIDVRAEITEAVDTIPAQAKALLVTDVTSMTLAGVMMKRIRAFRERLDVWMDPQIENATEAKRAAEKARKGLCDDKKLLDDPLQAAEALLAERIGAFEDEEELKRVRESERVRQVLETEANERLLAEAIRKEEEARQAPESLLRDVLLDEVEELLAEPLLPMSVELPKTTPSISGFSRPVKWEADLESLDDLLRALIDGKLDAVNTKDLRDRITKILPTPMMNQAANRLQAAFKMPGVKAVKDKGYRLK